MDVREWADVLGTAGFFVLLIVVVIQGARIWRARGDRGRDGGYRHLAETAVRNQEEIERQLRETTERLAELNARVATVERILKDVD